MTSKQAISNTKKRIVKAALEEKLLEINKDKYFDEFTEETKAIIAKAMILMQLDRLTNPEKVKVDQEIKHVKESFINKLIIILLILSVIVIFILPLGR
jgi:hypothetical protein